MEFIIGDRVVCNGEVDFHYSTRGECGVVIDDTSAPYILIQFDHHIPGAHSGNGRGRDGYCLWVNPDMLEPETSADQIIPAAEREYITL